MKKLSELFLPLAIALMIAFVFLREIVFFPMPDLIPNPDTSWLLYAAKRVMGGEKLYSDIMETNPPLIVWMSLIPVWIAEFFSASVFTVFTLFTTALSLISLVLAAYIMKSCEFFSEKKNFAATLLYISFGFFFLTPAIYGQREMLFIALVLPYLFLTLYSLPAGGAYIPSPLAGEGRDKSTIHTGMRFAAILLAAIGFAIKPFFLLLWGANELHNAIQNRKFSLIFAPHNFFIGFFQITYFALIYYFTPEYFTNIIPTVLATYFSFESERQIILKPVAIVAGSSAALLFFANPQYEARKPALRAFTWVLACSGLIIIQRKDWLNHLYPMVFTAGLLLVILTLYLAECFEDAGFFIGGRRIIALCGSAAALITVVYSDAKFHKLMYENPSKISAKLVEEINKHATGKNIYPLTFNLQPSFPAISLSSGVFRGGFHHLWPMAGIIIREQQNAVTPSVAKAREFFYNTVVHDFSKNPPQLVWVNENVNMERISGYDIEPENRDIIRFLSRDVRFAALWHGNYKKIGEIESEMTEDEKEKEENKNKKPEKYSIYKYIGKEHNE